MIAGLAENDVTLAIQRQLSRKLLRKVRQIIAGCSVNRAKVVGKPRVQWTRA